jgi:hypothetical protein
VRNGCTPRPFLPEKTTMPQHDADEALPEPRKRDIFRALVEAQDGAMTVAQSRAAVCERFGVSEAQLRQIEREGLDGEWPPL